MTAVDGPKSGSVVVAAIVVATTTVAAGIGVTVWVAHVDADSLRTPLANGGVFTLFALAGGVIVAARPDSRVGWAMLAGGALAVAGGACDAVARHLIEVGPPPADAAAPFAIAGQSAQGLGWMAMTLLAPAYFPDVARLERRWVSWALVTVAVASVLDPLLDPVADLHGVGSWQNPLAPTGAWGLLSPSAFLVHVPLMLVTLGAIIKLVWWRWRGGDKIRRQQILLVAAAAALPAVAVPVAIVSPWGTWVFALAAAPLPIAMGFAVLARGLYDLRSAANRTLVWLLLSAIVAGLYALVIGGVAALFDVDRHETWLPWLAAVVLALLCVPLRDALQGGVNRITFGRWDEPYEVLASLGPRLEATADVNRLLASVVAELEALGLDGVWIADADGEPVAGKRHADEDVDDPADAEAIELTAYGAAVGVLHYQRPRVALRNRDRRLLDDLAGHLGVVMHARRLSIDLQQALERVVLSREEERRRLRRDLHDGLGPALAGHLLQLDAIATRLDPSSPVRDEVDALRVAIRSTVLEVRRVVEGLRPPALDELGLPGALHQACTRVTATSPVLFELSIAPLPTLPAAAEVAAFRIVTEAVTNVVRHASATTCLASITPDGDQLHIVVIDDGNGIPARHRDGNGLVTMRERAEELGGTLRVVSPPGTVVDVRLPLHGSEPHQPSAMADT